MNEFTKEELQDLHQVYKKFCSSGEPAGLIALEKSILEKLQSMIDSYCNHERCTPVNALNVPLHCLDCGFKFE